MFKSKVAHKNMPQCKKHQILRKIWTANFITERKKLQETKSIILQYV